MRKAQRAGLASIATTALVIAGVAAPAMAAPQSMTLSSVAGPSGVGKTIIGTVPATTANPITFASGSSPTVQFQYSSCGNTAKTVTQIDGTGTGNTAGVLTVDPAQVQRISPTKIAFHVPTGAFPAYDANGNASTINQNGLVLAASQVSSKWSVCVYDSDSTTTSTLLATASYTITLRPTITGITPVSSPAGGGQTITVTGTGFTSVAAPITGQIGGVDLTNIKVAPNGTSLTAVTGPRAGGSNLALTITTSGGTVSGLDPDNNGQPQDNDATTNDAPIPFAYSNGITISPNTASVPSTVTVDVVGAGFAALDFDAGSTPTSANAHVFLVSGAYNSSTNRGVAECVVSAVISDNELVCALDLSKERLSPMDSQTVTGLQVVDGAYILTVVATGTMGASVANTNPTVISSGAAFIVAPY